MFVESTADPLNYVGAAWDAATAQLDRDDPSYQMGAAGYGKRFSAAVTDNATGDFFGIFLYPALFRQDPRYYRLGQGFHAITHRPRAGAQVCNPERFRQPHAELL
jgi:hypothetical protein